MVDPRTDDADLAAHVLSRLAGRSSAYARYRVVGEIARGGMGAILKVWDEDLRRDLAMKVILTSESGVAETTGSSERARLTRFLEEAQVTGQLEHPGIVPVHELGSDPDGRVYFTMKLVKGITLSQVLWLAREGRDEWNTTRVLGLLLRVCEAMAYAHSKGVIHRDLKPPNVMVGAFGEVHVMDWGLARILDREDAAEAQRRGASSGAEAIRGVRSEHRDRTPDSSLYTMDGDVLGTPAYMAPEQASGRLAEIGPQADVYALGAMLYELLAGHPPYLPTGSGSTPVEVWESVRNGPPASIAAVARSAPLELVAICDKAMARDWRERYADMSALASDLRAFLERRVVAAYRTGTWAETKKWIERNRALAASLASVVLVLGAGLAVALVLKRRSDANAELAAASANETRITADFQSRLLSELSVDELGRSLVESLRGEVEAGLRRGERSAQEIDESLATFDRVLATANPTNAARQVLVEQIFDRAVETLDANYGDRRKLAALLKLPLAETMWRLGLYDLGERTTRAALDTLRAEVGDRDTDTLSAMNSLAVQLRALGRPAEAEPLYRDVIAGYRELVGDHHANTLSCTGNLALVLGELGRHDEAEALLREALAGARASGGDVVFPLINLASVVGGRGARDEAETLLREAIATGTAAQGSDHPTMLSAANNLGMLLLEDGRLVEAEEIFRTTLEVLRRRLGDQDVTTLIAINNVGLALKNQGRLADAEPFFREAVDGWRARDLGGDARALTSISNLGNVLQNLERLAEAEPFQREAFAGARARFGLESPKTLTLGHNLVQVLRGLGELEQATTVARDLLAGHRAVHGAAHPDTLASMQALASMLRLQGHLAEAEPLYREALDGLRTVNGPDHLLTLRTSVGLTHVLLARGAFAEGEAVLAPAIERMREARDVPESLLREALELLRDLYRDWHAVAPEAGHDRRAVEVDSELQK